MRPTSRRALALGAVLLVAALAAGCADVADDEDITVVRPITPATTGEGGGLAWGGCTGDHAELQCAVLEVPVDHDDPTGETVSLGVARRPAGDAAARIGSLLVNPGGPGVPGTALLGRATDVFSPELLERFDIVVWDPRGTGSSAPIDCIDDLDPLMSPDPTPDSAAERTALQAAAQAFADACEEAEGDWLSHVSTVDSARDMDLLREALGEDEITYLGFSYGSELGATYATLFGPHVRAMVLDGAIDPSSEADDVSVQQAIGNELALDRFLDWCDEDDDCDFKGSRPARQAFDDLLADLDADPVSAARAARGRPTVGQGVAYTGIIRALYTPSAWPVLADALDDAAAGDGGGLLALYDDYNERLGDGTYTDTLEAFFAISCLDHGSPRDLASYDARAVELAAAAPRLGAVFAYNYVCALWPVNPVAPLVITAEDAGPVLVVAATGDGATPYASSQALAAQLEDGHLLTREGDGHTSYTSGDDCVRDAVDAYLLEGELPADGTVCR